MAIVKQHPSSRNAGPLWSGLTWLAVVARLLLLLLPAVVQAQYTYTTNGGAITITEYIGTNTVVTIPGTINGLPVTSLGSVFLDNYSLTSVTIPDSVTTIEGGAFVNCSSLTTITIPDSVTSIWGAAFGGCIKLTSIAIPASVTNITAPPFPGCTSLSAFTVDPNNAVYSSAGGLLFDKSQTTLIEYPGGIAGPYTIPESVTSIGFGAFESCTLMTSVTIPASVTNITAAPFADCTSLSDFTVDPNNVVYSSAGGLLFDKSQTTLIEYPGGITGPCIIPASVARIGYGAFTDCNGLTGVTIPDSVNDIEGFAFGGCQGLTSITIPNSVTNIGDDAFNECYRLTDVTISDSVTGIGNGVFSACIGLTNVTIPDSVTTIGGGAFESCSSLTTITIPDSVTSIGDYAFGYCTNLSGVYFLGNAPSLGSPSVFVGEVGYDPATVYYLPGATGFGITYGGLRTALWTGSSLVVVNLTADPTQGGAVVGGGTFAVGSSQQISATANNGWTFTGWSDGGAQTHDITVPSGGATFTANFTATTPTCTYTLSPSSVTLAAKGGSKTVKVKVKGADCSWTASTTNSWITITSSGSYTGSGTVRYTVPGNTNTTGQVGTMTIADQTFTVNQKPGGCTFKLSPKSRKFKAAGGSGTVMVKPNFSDCEWTATSTNDWITITAGASGVGTQPVNYTVAPNTSTNVLTGTITIAGETFTVKQAGVK